MKYVPHWVIDALMSKKFKCHHCQKVFTHKNVRALGVRDNVGEPNKESFFIELACPTCQKVTFFEMQDMNIIELSEEIISEIEADEEELEELDMFQDNKINKKKPSKKNKENIPEKKEMSKITLKDVREAKKILKPKDLKHDSFLEMLGMSPEEIVRLREEE